VAATVETVAVAAAVVAAAAAAVAVAVVIIANPDGSKPAYGKQIKKTEFNSVFFIAVQNRESRSL
jgi:hypothetical protein